MAAFGKLNLTDIFLGKIDSAIILNTQLPTPIFSFLCKHSIFSLCSSSDIFCPHWENQFSCGGTSINVSALFLPAVKNSIFIYQSSPQKLCHQIDQPGTAQAYRLLTANLVCCHFPFSYFTWSIAPGKSPHSALDLRPFERLGQMPQSRLPGHIYFQGSFPYWFRYPALKLFLLSKSCRSARRHPLCLRLCNPAIFGRRRTDLWVDEYHNQQRKGKGLTDCRRIWCMHQDAGKFKKQVVHTGVSNKTYLIDIFHSRHPFSAFRLAIDTCSFSFFSFLPFLRFFYIFGMEFLSFYNKTFQYFIYYLSYTRIC